EFSKAREKSFNCIQQPGGIEVWNTENVSGLEKQIASLLGLKNYSRRNLSVEPDPQNYFSFFSELPGQDVRFRLLGYNDEILLESECFSNLLQAKVAALQIIKAGMNRNNYGDHTIVNNSLNIPLQITNSGGITEIFAYASINIQINDDEIILRNKVIANVINRLIQIHKEGEGLYIVEHVLLRPTVPDNTSVDLLMTTHINDDNQTKDPYSFRISIVLPSGFLTDFNSVNSVIKERTWSTRFRNLDFRRLVEKIIIQETPAHILPRIYWLHANSGIDNPTTPSLNRFETVYREWLEAKTDASVTESAYINAQENLVRVLNIIIQNQ
ncbi:unnamed protein product, partial [marine sediment metagenome]